MRFFSMNNRLATPMGGFIRSVETAGGRTEGEFDGGVCFGSSMVFADSILAGDTDSMLLTESFSRCLTHQPTELVSAESDPEVIYKIIADYQDNRFCENQTTAVSYIARNYEECVSADRRLIETSSFTMNMTQPEEVKGQLTQFFNAYLDGVSAQKFPEQVAIEFSFVDDSLGGGHAVVVALTEDELRGRNVFQYFDVNALDYRQSFLNNGTDVIERFDAVEDKHENMDALAQAMIDSADFVGMGDSESCMIKTRIHWNSDHQSTPAIVDSLHQAFGAREFKVQEENNCSIALAVPETMCWTSNDPSTAIPAIQVSAPRCVIDKVEMGGVMTSSRQAGFLFFAPVDESSEEAHEYNRFNHSTVTDLAKFRG